MFMFRYAGRKWIAVVLSLFLLIAGSVPAFSDTLTEQTVRITAKTRDNGDISTWKGADGIYYLFVPNHVAIRDLVLEVSGILPQKTSTGNLQKTAGGAGMRGGKITGAFRENRDRVRISASDGTVLYVQVLQSDLPDVMIRFSGTDLEHVNAGSKDKKYDGNTVTIVDETGKKEVHTDVTIKGRGNSTWDCMEKKPYQLKFAEEVSVLGMPKAKKWLLLANAYDDSLMRTLAAFSCAEKLGMSWTTEFRPVNVWADGAYIGTYLLGEKIEVGDGRLELSNPQGSVFELDNGFYEEEEYYFSSVGGIYTVKDTKSGKDSDIRAAEETFDRTMTGLFTYLSGEKTPTVAGLSEYIDVRSFAQYYLMTEYFMNAESFVSSNYYYQDGPEDVIHAGPVWDYDSSMGNQKRDRISCVRYSALMTMLMSTPAFNGFVQRYYLYVRDIFAQTSDFVAATYGVLSPAAEMNYLRWDVLGKNVPWDKVEPFRETYAAAVSALTEWLDGRQNTFRNPYPMKVLRQGNNLVITYRPAQSVESIRAASWTAEGGQDDLRWTKGVQMANGAWIFTIPVTQCLHDGQLNLDLYNGDSALLSGGTYVSNRKSNGKPDLVDISGNGTVYRAGIYAKETKGTVSVAVWSEKNGRDDLKWYRMKNDGSGYWTADIPVSAHKTDGKYLADFYDGETYLGGTTFTVSEEAVRLAGTPT